MLLPKLAATASINISAMRNKKLAWSKNQLEEILRIWTEDKERARETKEILANELHENVVSINENTASLQMNMFISVKQKKLWDTMENILSGCSQYLSKIDCLNPSSVVAS